MHQNMSYLKFECQSDTVWINHQIIILFYLKKSQKMGLNQHGSLM